MPINVQNLNCFKIVNDRVVLNKDYLAKERWHFKKITGTRFAAIVGLNRFNSPFKVWMGMVNIYKDVIDPTLARTGNIIEPKVREYVSQCLNIDFKVYDPKAIGWDVFKENKVFGGIPDGEPLNNFNKIDYSTGMPMLEIKTTSADSLLYRRENNALTMVKDEDGIPIIKEPGAKKSSWFDGDQIVVSDEYCLQLGLYLYLRNTTQGLFAVAFLEPMDYVVPDEFDAETHDIQLATCSIDRAKLEPYIQYATKWYHNHIDQGISPKMTEDDQDWLESELRLVGR